MTHRHYGGAAEAPNFSYIELKPLPTEAIASALAVVAVLGYPDDYFTLAMEKAEILVCHEAPSCHPYGYS